MLDVIFGRRARSLALGCMVALGGCDGERIEVEGVVRDGRTGRPIAGAVVSTHDGRRTETDDEGRFAVEVEEGHAITAEAGDRCPATESAEARAPRVTLNLFDALDLETEHDHVGFDTDVRIEVRARCDLGSPLRWSQVAGPDLSDGAMRVEDDGHLLVVHTHPERAWARQDERVARGEPAGYRFRVEWDGTPREVRVTPEEAVRLPSVPRVDPDGPRPMQPVGDAGAAGSVGEAVPGGCSACHGSGGVSEEGAMPPDAEMPQGGACARCHDVDEDGPIPDHVSPTVDEWELASMGVFLRDRRDDDPARRAGCASCHSTQGFVEWRRRGARVAPDPRTVQAITCGACHDAHDASRPFGVRMHDTSDPIAGEAGTHMGTGALCASCHRAASFGDAEPGDRAPHAPQANVLLGRGARVHSDEPEGAHRWIADTCVRCHMVRPPAGDPLRTRAGGHTFAMRGRRGTPDFNAASCAGCHGDVAPASIGARDWDGDGESGPIGEEFDRALALVSARVSERVRAASVEDACGRVAVDITDFDARLVLVSASGAMLGDCDGDGRFGEAEVPVTVAALDETLRDAAYDLCLLRRDGSRGVHHPTYTFGVIASAIESLR